LDPIRERAEQFPARPSTASVEEAFVAGYRTTLSELFPDLGQRIAPDPTGAAGLAGAHAEFGSPPPVRVLQKEFLVHQSDDIRQETSPLIALHGNLSCPSSQFLILRCSSILTIRRPKTPHCERFYGSLMLLLAT
jgi:hypothetical protein